METLNQERSIGKEYYIYTDGLFQKPKCIGYKLITELAELGRIKRTERYKFKLSSWDSWFLPSQILIGIEDSNTHECDKCKSKKIFNRAGTMICMDCNNKLRTA